MGQDNGNSSAGVGQARVRNHFFVIRVLGHSNKEKGKSSQQKDSIWMRAVGVNKHMLIFWSQSNNDRSFGLVPVSSLFFFVFFFRKKYYPKAVRGFRLNWISQVWFALCARSRKRHGDMDRSTGRGLAGPRDTTRREEIIEGSTNCNSGGP
jgi:hypothetical protein